MNNKSKYSTSSLIDMYTSMKDYYGKEHADKWVKEYLTDDEKARLASAISKSIVKNWSIVAIN